VAVTAVSASLFQVLQSRGGVGVPGADQRFDRQAELVNLRARLT
jgi:hypothetical protein